MNHILKNSLVEWLNPAPEQPEGPFIERVLSIEPDATVVVIEVTERKGLSRIMPYVRTRAEIDDALETGKAQILQSDQWRKAPSSNPAHLELRDAAWEAIRPIVEIKRGFRGKALRKAIRDCSQKTPRQLIHRWLRKYWVGGQTKDALLPRFKKCGGKGKARERGKPGPKHKFANSRGKELTQADRNKMDEGIQRFYNNATRPTIRQAYRLTIENYYHEGYQEKDGHFSPVLLPPEECPSFHQFQYRLANNLDLKESLVKRFGQRKYHLRFRPVTGTHAVLGPGAHWAIDATRADVRVLSSINPNQSLERPTIYLIVDYYTKLIVGLYVTLDDPSYRCASLAILNAASSKEAFCAQYGLSITGDLWPARGIPDAILADRGELRGPIAEPIIDGLEVRLDNTPPYRADLKAAVERMFKALNDELLHSLPGRIIKDQTRGDEPSAMNAQLTLKELTRLVIKWAIVHNNKPLSKHWLPSGGADVEPTPAGLWRWGLTNANASLRDFPEEELRIALLPKGSAAVGRRGISFRKTYYDSQTAREEDWFVGSSKDAGRIECRYDPNDASAIYIPKGDGFEKCPLTEADHLANGRAWAELDALLHSQQQRKVELAVPTAQLQAELHAEIQEFHNRPKLPRALRRLKALNTQEATRLEKTLLANPPSPKPTPLLTAPSKGQSLQDEIRQRNLKLLEELDENP